MRVFAGVSALLLGSLCASSVVAKPRPNFEFSKTSVQIDSHREALDNGEILVRVERTSDLFADPTASEDAKLLLEKNTHIALRIQLDHNAGKVNVNDEPMDITSDEPKVAVVKAETFTLPEDHKSPVADADMMLSLLGQMSPGIVGVEVKIESEAVSPSMEMVTVDETGDVKAAVEKVSVRKVSLWIRVTEVEGHELPHTTTTYTPILQLIVTGSGNKVHKIATLSIDGRPPVTAAHHGPGPAVGMALPPIEIARPHHHGQKHPESVNPEMIEVNEGLHRGHAHPHAHSEEGGKGPFLFHGHHHAHHERPSGFISWLMSFLGFPPPPPRPRFAAKGMKRPCPGHLKKIQGAVITEGEGHAGSKESHRDHHHHDNDHEEVKGKDGKTIVREGGKTKLPSHRIMSENPFSGDFDDDEGYDVDEVDEENFEEVVPIGALVGKRPFHPHEKAHKHHRHHHRHSKVARFFRRMAIGFVYGMALIGTLFMNPVSLVAMLVLLCAGAVAFHGARRLSKLRRQEGSIRLDDEGSNASAPSMGEKEKEVYLDQVVVDDVKEDLPRYESRA